ncbi:MAG: phosphoribosylformylglycinamidine synthase subunit PurQ [Candidatus Thermoplasmatota archaeon]|jgi:phosphoribosylformylglycinamidine synthase|nr:phosphoribosylformylglycinamidine synthase subunit PurQ [Candidatus Thermoplasmatota archaeon]MCL5794231.1 phosphoribosylformylglycinamidine synthase subunit PurQ [Candidatus Thermoplasmatota archaeon]
MEGTNNEEETYIALRESGFSPEYVHVKQLENGTRKIKEFSLIFIPGGFSAGDYVRAGAIFSARLRKSSIGDFEEFSDLGKPIIGACNGFQVLAEMGMLPDADGKKSVDMTVSINESARFECRYIYLKVDANNPLMAGFQGRDIPWVAPVAHSEGRVIFSSDSLYEKMKKNGQVIFTYVDPEGKPGEYPWNPNGSRFSIAGISNRKGNVIGLMPHPERIYFPKLGIPAPGGDTFGNIFFRSLYEYTISSTEMSVSGVRSRVS